MTKSQILNQIQRTATENGGKPLGSKRFETETGIKTNVWSRYWGRWGDAVRDARLSPNQYQTAYDEAELLGRYADLARELQRLPTKGDLTVKHHSDTKFPSENAFARRYEKPELVKRVRAYCQNHDGYTDVVLLCDQYTPPRRQLPEKAVKLHEIRTDDPVGIENYWHKRFEAKRKHGEWFDLNAGDVAAFKRRKFM